MMMMIQSANMYSTVSVLYNRWCLCLNNATRVNINESIISINWSVWNSAHWFTQWVSLADQFLEFQPRRSTSWARRMADSQVRWTVRYRVLPSTMAVTQLTSPAVVKVTSRLWGNESESTSNEIWPCPRPTSVSSGIASCHTMWPRFTCAVGKRPTIHSSQYGQSFALTHQSSEWKANKLRDTMMPSLRICKPEHSEPVPEPSNGGGYIRKGKIPWVARLC